MQIIYAGCCRRYWAFIIDGLLLLTAFAIIEKICFTLFHTFDIRNKVTEQITASLKLLAFFIYFVLMESPAKQATAGKIILGVRVTNIDGNRITTGKAFKRTLGKSLSFILIFIRFIMICFTKKKQALHDILAGCLVVRN